MKNKKGKKNQKIISQIASTIEGNQRVWMKNFLILI